MSKLLSLLGAGVLALSFSGIAAAADNTTTQQQNQPQTQQSNQAQPGSAEQREQEYLAALKKCDAMSNAGDKQKCIDAAKKKHGQM
jgi:hypothetical protein